MQGTRVKLYALIADWALQNHSHTSDFLSLAERAQSGGRQDLAVHFTRSVGTLDLITQSLLELLTALDRPESGSEHSENVGR